MARVEKRKAKAKRPDFSPNQWLAAPLSSEILQPCSIA
jgi:hypothetical protein